MTTNDMTPIERSQSYRDAAGLAKANAETAFAAGDIVRGRAAEERADHYLRLAETMLEIAKQDRQHAA